LMQHLFFVAFAYAVGGRPQAAMQLIDEQQALCEQYNNRPLWLFGALARAKALEHLGQVPAAITLMQSITTEMAEQSKEPDSTDHYDLEVDRMTNDLASAATRVARFRAKNDLLGLHLAFRYFPSLKDQLDSELIDKDTDKNANKNAFSVPLAATEIPIISPAISPAITSTTPIALEVLGTMRVYGQVLPERAHKGKQLLALLLEARIAGRTARSRLELIDLLYGEMPESKASSALKQQIYRLRTTFGAETIVNLPEGYALGLLGSDAEQFLTSGDIQLWRGPYLADLGTGWPGAVGEALHSMLRERLLTYAQPAVALRVAELVLAADPFDASLQAVLEQLQANERKAKA
jgi:hypothetical protein